MTGTWRPTEPSAGDSARYERLAAIHARIYPALAPLFADIAADAAAPVG